MSHRSEHITTNQNSKNAKSIPEMTWEEILALPTENISNKKIAEFRMKEADRKRNQNS
jgi:hypothetical protein